ncbi:hypothetical protein BH10ACI3_BH10ACI3_11680 [soil metagenome]
MYFSLTIPTPVFRRLAATVLTVVIGLLIIPMSAAAQSGDEQPDAVAIFNEAQELHEKGDLAGAIKLYQKAIAVLPEFPEAEYQCGIAEIAMGKNEAAEKSFRRAIELRQDWTLAMSSLGSLLVQTGEFAEAETVLTHAIELDELNFPAVAAITELRLKTNASTKSLSDLLTKIVVMTTKASPPASIWVARAALEDRLGIGSAARQSINKALAIDPNNKYAIAQSAQIALTDGDVERAGSDAARLEKLTPASEVPLLIRARLLAYDAKTDEALKLLDTIKTPSPEAVALRKQLVTTASQNPFELERQLAADPNDPKILGRLCTLFRRDSPTKALEYCRRASQAEPKNVNHAVGFGAALVQAKQLDAAVDFLRKLIVMAPENSTAHANLATALFQSKRYVEAKPEFEWLANAQPKSPTPYYFLGIVHDQLNELMDAMANYQLYLKLADPVVNKLDMERVHLRLPGLQRQIKEGKGKKNGRG